MNHQYYVSIVRYTSVVSTVRVQLKSLIYGEMPRIDKCVFYRLFVCSNWLIILIHLRLCSDEMYYHGNLVIYIRPV